MQTVIGIPAMPRFFGIKIKRSRIHPFRLGRQAVTGNLGMENKVFQVDAVPDIAVVPVRIRIHRIEAFLFAPCIGSQNGIVVGNIANRQKTVDIIGSTTHKCSKFLVRHFMGVNRIVVGEFHLHTRAFTGSREGIVRPQVYRSTG